MHMSKRVLFISSFCLPEGDAGATRLLMLARALRMEGCDVELCGMGDATCFDDFTIHTLNPGRHNKVLNWLSWRTMGIRAASFVRKNLKKFDAIVASFLPSGAVEKIKQLCSECDVVLSVDCTEWFESSQFPKGERDRGYLDHERLLTRTIDESVKVIAISDCLKNHFEQMECSVLRVPAVLDVEELSAGIQNEVCDHGLKVMYAGSPGKKDSLDIVLGAICELSADERSMISLDLYGLDERDARMLLPVGVSLPTCVHAHGRVSRAEVVKALRKSDFTILMRDPSKRFAQAGMPTKITESLGSGVPVIANLTSDLGKYLVDGVNAFIVDRFAADALACVLRKALVTTHEDRLSMREAARASAEDALDYRVYAHDLRAFVLEEGGCNRCA